jgi:hypothetical protein
MRIPKYSVTYSFRVPAVVIRDLPEPGGLCAQVGVVGLGLLQAGEDDAVAGVKGKLGG